MASVDADGAGGIDTGPAATDDGVALPLGTVFELLADQQRRYALYYLKHMTGDRVSLETLLDKIASWEALDSEQDVATLRSRVAETFRRVHLPRFVETGIVDYIPDTATIRYTHHWALEELLEQVGETTY